MSAAKRTLRRVISSWLNGESAAPQLLRRCEICGEKCWRPLGRCRSSASTIDAQLPNGARADLLLTDDRGGVRAGDPARGRQPARQPGRSARRAAAGGPARGDARGRAPPLAHAARVQHAGLALPLRRHALAPGRRRLLAARDRLPDPPAPRRRPALLRRVIEDCGRCAFFVGIGYVGADRRRIQLRCGFGAPPAERRPPAPAPLLELESASPNRGWIVTALPARARASCRQRRAGCSISTFAKSASVRSTTAGARRESSSGSTWSARCAGDRDPARSGADAAARGCVATAIESMRRRARGAAVVVRTSARWAWSPIATS